MNIWKQFENLLPKDPLLIGTVITHNTGNTSTVQFPEGGYAVVYGQDVAISSKAFVKSGRIQGLAPSLSYYEFEV